MNHAYEQEIRYRLLKILTEEPKLGQREMAKKMGISLGKVNFCVSELAAKGWIKITRLKSARKKIPKILYILPALLNRVPFQGVQPGSNTKPTKTPSRP